jgi:hypothetical protein
MFRTPVAELPHPHGPDADLDAEARFRRIVAQLDEIGRRNDALRRQIAAAKRVDALMERDRREP